MDAIPQSNVLADVGCDHGYVGIEALKRGVASQVIFTDISAACLQKARQNCPSALKRNAFFVCRDGLGDIECDTAVICGMGGLEILSILNGAKRLPDAVVLQPMRNIVDTRKFVAERYEITQDFTVHDGKFYSVIVGQNRGRITRKMTDLELEFGITNINNPTVDFIDYLRNEEKKILQIMLNCDSAEMTARLKQVQRALSIALNK